MSCLKEAGSGDADSGDGFQVVLGIILGACNRLCSGGPRELVLTPLPPNPPQG